MSPARFVPQLITMLLLAGPSQPPGDPALYDWYVTELAHTYELIART